MRRFRLTFRSRHRVGEQYRAFSLGSARMSSLIEQRALLPRAELHALRTPTRCLLRRWLTFRVSMGTSQWTLPCQRSVFGGTRPPNLLPARALVPASGATARCHCVSCLSLYSVSVGTERKPVAGGHASLCPAPFPPATMMFHPSSYSVRENPPSCLRIDGQTHVPRPALKIG